MGTENERDNVVPFPSKAEPDSVDFESLLAEMDADEEEFFREWEEAETECVEILRAALAEHVGVAPPALGPTASSIRTGVAERSWPYHHLAAAACWSNSAPDDDQRCCVEAAAAYIAMGGETGLGPEIEASIIALQFGHWLGAVVGLVRAGVGAPADATDLVRYIDECPEVEGELDFDEAELVSSAFDSVLYAWEVAGVVDRDRRLTPVGEWVLPRALAYAWSGDFDEGGPGELGGG